MITTKKRLAQPETDAFRVIALVSTYNEGDVISCVIEHLLENGVDVYLLDNHSTDDTVEQASQWLGRGLLDIEVFPGADGRYSTAAERYDWTAILRRKEELARTLRADWFLHHDADEIREPPWAGVSLKDAIRFVDSLDYNCIDFRVFEFPPLDDGFRQGMDPRTYFTHFRDAQDYDQLQLKGWKSRSSPVSLVHFGGHDVEFEGKRVFPIRFLLRHYPIRSQTHGRRKVFEERKQRFSADERAKSWHRQYDHIKDQEYSFIADPETLRPFDVDRARLDVLLQNRDAAARTKASETAIAELQSSLGSLGQELDSFVRREVEYLSMLAERKSAVEALETQVESLRGQLPSKTWKWGVPIGTWILKICLFKRRSDGGPDPSHLNHRGVRPTAVSRIRIEKIVNRLRNLKVKLGSSGVLGQLMVPAVEVCEFSLSHGLREVVIRARRRLARNASRPATQPVESKSTSSGIRSRAAAVGIKLVAFYLPQYHPIPENDAAWGKGFTEWTNVTRARPLFDGHYQPHLPSDLGFYDLRVAETREEQARLARSYGLYGFCYYYYWFDRKRLLNAPFDDLLRSGKPDLPFCICWANEPWSRRWDGSDHEIIIAQEYRDGYADRFVEDVIPILRDSRYIRVDGKPLLIVYRIDHLPEPSAAAAIWREACRRDGVGEICLAAMGTNGTTDPQPSGFDVSIEFPPHNLTEVQTIEGTLRGLRNEFVGRVRDYSACVETELKRRPNYPQFRGLMTGWDNTPRRGDTAMLFHNATPAAYEKWLGGLLDVAQEASAPHSPFVFINAWNEWAEGAHLEPDQKHGHAYLKATASALLKHKYKDLFGRGFPLHDTPAVDVSIVIPVYNQVDFTLACLDSLARHGSGCSVEILVVDDGSVDLTEQLVRSIPGLRYMRCVENQGFIRSCNLAAAAARGDYVVFLNNDTLVRDEWLDELRGTFDLWPEVGLVGSKLVWPNGRIQECGSLVNRDGSAENYGRGDDPNDPRYCYARESDYVTGAAIMIRKRVFEMLGGFEEVYAPGYYEDVDLAFKVREAGLRVIVNPRAVVIHHEGGTSGTDVTVGIKRYQVVNRYKFLERWKHVLGQHPEQADWRMTKREKRVLVIDWVVPRPDRDAGSVRMMGILRILRSLGYAVTFVSRDGSADPHYTAPLERLGIEVLRRPYIESVQRYLAANGEQFGHVIVSRRDVATMHMQAVKQLCPGARVIFDTVDLHFVRETRQLELENDQPKDLAAQLARKELDAVTMADVTLVVSSYDRDVLSGMLRDVDIRVVSTIHEQVQTPRPFQDRAGLIFVGYFAHTPNADAVTWFVREVLPHIQLTDPHFRVHIVGSEPPPDILKLTSDRVTVHGYVADLEALFNGCRMSIAPLRYGSGVKGKIGQSLALGVPCVTTAIGAEGMDLEDGITAMIADTAVDFAKKIERVYQDEKLWLALRKGGLDLVERNMSVKAARRALEDVFAVDRNVSMCAKVEPLIPMST